MASMFQPATREKLNAKIALCGTTGCGKTFTALTLATYLLGDKPVPAMVNQIAVIDTEHGKSRLYSSGAPFYFSFCELKKFTPEAYVAALRDALAAGFRCIIIDGLSDEWDGTGGVLESIDALMDSGKVKDKRSAWAIMTPRHNAAMREITNAPAHVFCTIRSKPAYDMIEGERGKKQMQRIGMAPICREGTEHLFDIVADMGEGARMRIGKTRCAALFDQVFHMPGKDVADIILNWLEQGDDTPRTLDEAIERYAAKVVGRGEAGKEQFKLARGEMARWLIAKNIDAEEGDAAQKRLGDIVKAAVEARTPKPAATPADPAALAAVPANGPPDDAEKLRQIDAGTA